MIITKERVNEIGVLKAIGLPNSKIVTQFLSESIFMASLGFVVCILITLVAGPMMQTMLIESGSNDVSSTEEESTPQRVNPLNKTTSAYLPPSSTWPISQSYARVLFYGFNHFVGVFCRRKEYSYEFWINDFNWNNWSALSHIGGIENATSASIEVRMR